MFEHRQQPLLSPREFALRLARCAGLVALILTFSLAPGSAGYHYLGDLPWIDSLLNAAMILTGGGPVDRMASTGGKFFATSYALSSGIAFLTMMAVLLAPVVHRLRPRCMPMSRKASTISVSVSHPPWPHSDHTHGLAAAGCRS